MVESAKGPTLGKSYLERSESFIICASWRLIFGRSKGLFCLWGLVRWDGCRVGGLMFGMFRGALMLGGLRCRGAAVYGRERDARGADAPRDWGPLVLHRVSVVFLHFGCGKCCNFPRKVWDFCNLPRHFRRQMWGGGAERRKQCMPSMR